MPKVYSTCTLQAKYHIVRTVCVGCELFRYRGAKQIMENYFYGKTARTTRGYVPAGKVNITLCRVSNRAECATKRSVDRRAGGPGGCGKTWRIAFIIV